MRVNVLAAGLLGLGLTLSGGPDGVLPMGQQALAADPGARPANVAEPVHYRARKYGVRKHRHAGRLFVLRRPEYGMLPFVYDRRARYPYRCIPPTAAQFHYCRERFLTIDQATGALVSYAPYGHLCACW